MRRIRSSFSHFFLQLMAFGLLGTGMCLPVSECCPVEAAERRALLVGCSEYSGNISPLPGAANDVARCAALLRSEFGFTDVETLSATTGPDRPTADRIVRAFQSLIERTRPGDIVFILLSGHGTQFPVSDDQADLLDPANPEPDGLDEVFLPVDYAAGRNMIRDNQFGEWLSQLRSRSAHVWIVFDCCFSGTMMRGAADAQSITRGVDPRAAGVSESQLQHAQQRAAALAGRTGADTLLPQPETDDDLSQQGSVVAFYACQPFETAKEVYRPEDGPRVPENKTGLLSHHLLAALRRCREQITYRDLSRRLLVAIRAERGSRGPTPMFEGDLDRTVLDFETWPDTALYLERQGAEWRVSGGRLAGLHPGDVLSVHLLDKSKADQIQAYVRVAHSGTSASVVQPIDYAGTEAEALNDLNPPLRCRPVEMRPHQKARIAVAEFCPPTHRKIVEQFLAQAAENGNSTAALNAVDDPAAADFLLTWATPAEAAKKYGFRLPEPGLLLLEPVAEHSRLSGSDRSAGRPYRVLCSPGPFKKQPADDTGALDQLRVHLRRVRIWKNLWKVAADFGDGASGRTRLRLRVVREADSGDEEQPAVLRAGDRLNVYLDNYRYSPVWYTVLFLNGDYGVEFVDAGSVRARRTFGEPYASVKVDHCVVTAESTGVEGYIVIGVSQKDSRAAPDFRFLEQPAVGQPDTLQRSAQTGSRSLFGELLKDAVDGQPVTRGAQPMEDAEVSAFSWVTVDTSR